MSGFAGFLGGVGRGMQFGLDMRQRKQDKADREEDRAMRREEMDLRRQEIDSPSTPPFFPGDGGRRRGRSVAGGSGRPYITGDPVAEDMEPHQRAFLNSIAGGESNGAYNVRYSPRGPVTFDGDEHPRIFEPGPHGPSSAAGRYQFTASTWDDEGGGAFTREMQDRRAYSLAQKRYRSTTGRDLDADLRARGLTDDMMDSLTPTWQAFGKNRPSHVATYNDSLRRYSPAPAPAAAPVARSVAPPAPQAWGTVRRLMAA